MYRTYGCVLIALLAACGGDTSDTTQQIVVSTSESCETHWECINDACSCTSGPEEGNSCDDPEESSGPDNCDDLCEVCS